MPSQYKAHCCSCKSIRFEYEDYEHSRDCTRITLCGIQGYGGKDWGLVDKIFEYNFRKQTTVIEYQFCEACLLLLVAKELE